MSEPRPGFRITEIYAALCVGDDDEEGVPAVQLGPMALPLIAADERRLDWLRRAARDVVIEMGVRVEIVKFTTRETTEVIDAQ